MTNTSKALLDLESDKSPAESKLLFCVNHDLPSQPKPTRISLPEKKPVITSVPKSQVLGKLKDFLPVMSEANKKLQLAAMDNTKVFDIESLEDDDSARIEMDLILGVADLHTPEAVAAAESAINGNQPVFPFAAKSNSDEDSDEDDDTGDDGDNDSTSDDDEDKNQSDCDKHDQGKNDSELKCSVANMKRAESVGKGTSEELRTEKSSKRPNIVELS
ncbi:E3 ubiquitin-protein ligase RNF34 [Heracleum sosnowskyi]|uniref:E3 ubiquitin-protein ligase RNF34 n=1 Tax=Heracleum sosnowskyi TaxID=360622 RepID=A0AAD8I2P8_9APIA|nr:E3 ubiquitin-protein ligase RNF34 [Heracleum sosnowskyi]